MWPIPIHHAILVIYQAGKLSSSPACVRDPIIHTIFLPYSSQRRDIVSWFFRIFFPFSNFPPFILLLPPLFYIFKSKRRDNSFVSWTPHFFASIDGKDFMGKDSGFKNKRRKRDLRMEGCVTSILVYKFNLNGPKWEIYQLTRSLNFHSLKNYGALQVWNIHF